MAKKKISTIVELKGRTTEQDLTTLSINITIPTKLFYIAEAITESQRIESIEKSFEIHLDNYFEKIYEIIAPDRAASEKQQPSKSKKSVKPEEEK